jgi:hypothetical protein
LAGKAFAKDALVQQFNPNKAALQQRENHVRDELAAVLIP